MFKILTIPFDHDKKSFADEVLNDFIMNKAVRHYQAEFFNGAGKQYWTVFIEYNEVLEKTPEKAFAGMNEPQRLLLERLKEWRKDRAGKDGVPVYIVATNSELYDVVRKGPVSIEVLKGIKGFGKGKIGKYGEELVQIIKTFYEKS